MEMLGAALGIHLTLTGMSSVLAGITTLGQELKLTEAQVNAAGSGLKSLAAEAAFMGLAMFKAGEDETLRLTLQGVTQDAGLAARQVGFVRGEFDKGLFDKDDLGKSVQLFDQAGASLKNLFPLTEELALRSGKSLGAVSQYVTELSGGATARLQGLLKPAGITVDALRAAGLNIDEHYKTNDSAAKIIAALKEVTSKGSISGALGGGFLVAYKSDLAAISEFLRSIGNGLLPMATPVMHFLGGLVRTITFLNDLTGGWASNVLLMVGAFMGIAKILPLISALVESEKIAAFWGAIMTFANNPWGSIVSGISLMVGVIKELANAEKLAAAWTAILDALDGNWVALGLGAAVAAGVGVAWHFANGGGDDSDIDPKTSPAERPSRRSDQENWMSRNRAKAYA